MKKTLLFALLGLTYCLPSVGQIRAIYEDGETVDCFGGIADAIFDFRVIYGRYPKDKNELLDYHLDAVKYDSTVLDYSFFRTRALESKMVTKQIKNRRNKISVSGDTCSFYIAKNNLIIQCIGGPAEMQIYNYDYFLSWIRSRFYDKDGKHIWSLDSESPMMPIEINQRFRYVVTLEPNLQTDGLIKEEAIDGSPMFSPVLIPISLTRSGAFSYDVSSLKAIQLYYQEQGKPFSSDNALGRITIDDAIDPDRLDAIKAYMKDFLDKQKNVCCIKLWELVLFNNPPGVTKKHQ